MPGPILGMEDLDNALHQLERAKSLGLHSWIVRASPVSTVGVLCNSELLKALEARGFLYKDFGPLQIFETAPSALEDR